MPLRTAPRFLPQAIPAIVNGVPGALYGSWEAPQCGLGFTVTDGRIAELHLLWPTRPGSTRGGWAARRGNPRPDPVND